MLVLPIDGQRVFARDAQKSLDDDGKMVAFEAGVADNGQRGGEAHNAHSGWVMGVALGQKSQEPGGPGKAPTHPCDQNEPGGRPAPNVPRDSCGQAAWGFQSVRK